VTLLLDELNAPAPTLFVADTVKVYAVPAVKPVTVIGLDEPVAVIQPGELLAVYPVIVAPPLLAGAVNATVAVVLLVTAVAVPMVGAPGTVVCVTGALALLTLPVSKALTARTVKV
jgi:hypothetical protein